MASISDGYFKTELETRRRRLTSAIETTPTVEISKLLAEVDSALERLAVGTFGICETCHDTVEFERLAADPLVRFCLDHLTIKERRALEQDVETAASIQRSLLPPAEIRSAGWHFHYRYKPAGVVSGDYCDVIQSGHGDGAVVFLLGDVTGKGLSASMLMAHLHAMFRSLIPLERPIAHVLELANRLFCESTIGGLYATLVCGRASRNGDVEIGSAGHPPVWVTGCANAKSIDATGLPLGMFSSAEYTTETLRLEPAQSLVLYTDGLSESRDAEGTEYGDRKLREFVETQYHLNPVEFSAAFLNDLQNHSADGQPSDDLTLMVIRRLDS
ncbi:MAG: SpoIIE family protein phosphatase [Candidatus Acidiferrales bacterium]